MSYFNNNDWDRSTSSKVSISTSDKIMCSVVGLKFDAIGSIKNEIKMGLSSKFAVKGASFTYKPVKGITYSYSNVAYIEKSNVRSIHYEISNTNNIDAYANNSIFISNDMGEPQTINLTEQKCYKLCTCQTTSNVDNANPSLIYGTHSQFTQEDLDMTGMLAHNLEESNKVNARASDPRNIDIKAENENLLFHSLSKKKILLSVGDNSSVEINNGLKFKVSDGAKIELLVKETGINLANNSITMNIKNKKQINVSDGNINVASVSINNSSLTVGSLNISSATGVKFASNKFEAAVTSVVNAKVSN